MKFVIAVVILSITVSQVLSGSPSYSSSSSSPPVAPFNLQMKFPDPPCVKNECEDRDLDEINKELCEQEQKIKELDQGIGPVQQGIDKLGVFVNAIYDKFLTMSDKNGPARKK
jgi:uncharacterized coiled-coil protein SlyX